MTMIRKVMPAQITALGEDEVQVIISTGYVARDEHIFEPGGAQLDNYRKNPVVLWNHMTEHPPVGRGEDLQVDGDNIVARVRFAPIGISVKADEIRGLVKAGFINAVSVGIDPIAAEPLDPKKPRGGQRVSQWELMEFSFCNIPVDTGALVTQRSKEKTGMSDKKGTKGDRTLKAKHARAIELAPAVPSLKRGLYEVANLAYMLEQFGYAHACSEWEAEIEGDESPVPAMLGEALVKFGEAFIAMSKEEVTELLAGKDLELDDEETEIETRDLPAEERAYVSAAKTPRSRSWRLGIVMARAGKTLSATNAKKLDEAQGNCDRAMKHHKALGEHNQAVNDQLSGAQASNDKAATANTQVGESLAAAKDDPEKAPEHVARALKAQKALDGHLGDIADAHTNATDRCQDVGDAHNGIGRSIKSAQRCMRAVVDGSTPGEDSDSKDEQKSDGTDDDKDDSERSFRMRRVRVLALAALN